MTVALMPAAPRAWWRTLDRLRGPLVASAMLLLVVLVLNLSVRGGLSYFDFSSTTTASAALVLAAIGLTIVLVVGGMDLSAGAVMSLVNCLLVTHLQDGPAALAAWSVLGVAAGGAIGAVNGFVVAYLRVQPIIATLATMFVVHGLTLLVLAEPGGMVPPDFSALLTGDLVPGLLPMPAAIILLGVAAWLILKRTRLGLRLFAVGSSPEAANAKGVNVPLVRLSAYTIAGLFYGASGVFLTAQIGSGDPNLGSAMLLPIFAAAVLGGTPLGGGKGGAVGTAVGGIILMLVINLLLVFNVPTYYSTIVEAGLLILAVLIGSLDRIAALLWRLTSARPFAGTRGPIAGSDIDVSVEARHDPTLTGNALRRYVRRRGEAIRFLWPALAALALAVLVTAIVLRGQLAWAPYFNSMLVLASFLAVLGLGQGLVVLSGGLDLSMPAAITFAGVLVTGLAGGSNADAMWAIPAILAGAAAVGAINGFAVAVLGLSPFIMTLAMNGILLGASLLYCNGTPFGTSPPALSWLMTGKIGGWTPVGIGLVGLAVGGGLLLSRSVFGRQLLAVGNSRTVARYAGVPVERTTITAYALSTMCAAVTGLMLVGFSGQAFNDMGDPYLLPSIAVVVLGGSRIAGGRGNYLGILSGALAITVISALLSSLMVPQATREIIFGLVILAAVLGMREHKA